MQKKVLPLSIALPPQIERKRMMRGLRHITTDSLSDEFTQPYDNIALLAGTSSWVQHSYHIFSNLLTSNLTSIHYYYFREDSVLIVHV